MRASGVAAEVDAAAVPAIHDVEALLGDDGAVSGGSRRNAGYAEGFATFADDVPAWRRRLLSDATTSGGLLVAVPRRVPRRVPATSGDARGRRAGRIAVR